MRAVLTSLESLTRELVDDLLSGEHAELARPERVRQFKQYIKELESKYNPETLLAGSSILVSNCLKSIMNFSRPTWNTQCDLGELCGQKNWTDGARFSTKA